MCCGRMCCIDRQTPNHVTGVSSAVASTPVTSAVGSRLTGWRGVLSEAECSGRALADDLADPLGWGIRGVDPRVDADVENFWQ